MIRKNVGYIVGALIALAAIGLWRIQRPTNETPTSTPVRVTSDASTNMPMLTGRELSVASQSNEASSSTSGPKTTATSMRMSQQLAGDITNLWGIVSADGRAIDNGRATLAISAENYDSILRELSRQSQEENVTAISSAIESQIRNRSVVSSIAEMGCNQRMCVGRLNAKNAADLNKVIAGLVNGDAADRIVGGVSVNATEGTSEFGRFVLFTDPSIKYSVVRSSVPLTTTGTARNTQTQREELRAALRRTFDTQNNPAPPKSN